MLEYFSMFGLALRNARKAEGLTQAELAAAVGVTQPVVSRWERGLSRPSPRQSAALRKRLGAPEPSAPVPTKPAVRRLPEREPERLPLPIASRLWQRPEVSGDLAVVTALPRDDVLVAVVDIAGHGDAAAPAAHHVRGWLHGWVAARTAAVRLDELVHDLASELRAARLHAAWLLAVVGRGDRPHSADLHLASHSFPAPLLLAGPGEETRPTKGDAEAGPAPSEVSWARHEETEAPWRLVVTTDGLLARLGAGDERKGKGSVRRWMSGVTREEPPEDRLGPGPPRDDETLLILEWSAWDEERESEASSSDDRRRVLRILRRSTLDRGEEETTADRVLAATAEALANVARYAYADRGPARLRWRHTTASTQVEIADEGVGGPIEEGGGFQVMRRQAETVRHWERHPSGKKVLLTFGRRKDEAR